ncbi:cytochrome P450 [Sphingomonas sp. MMS24-JH45]
MKHFFRTVTQDYTLGDTTFRAGDHVMLNYGAATRDKAVFPDAQSFRADRAPNNHLAFGYGPHQCLGQFLAKMEIEAFIRALVARVDRIEATGPALYTEASFVSGIRSLPVRCAFASNEDCIRLPDKALMGRCFSIRPASMPIEMRSRIGLHDALERLIETIDLGEITVSALAKEAGVGRPVFYRLYRDIDALLADRLGMDLDGQFAAADRIWRRQGAGFEAMHAATVFALEVIGLPAEAVHRHAGRWGRDECRHDLPRAGCPPARSAAARLRQGRGRSNDLRIAAIAGTVSGFLVAWLERGCVPAIDKAATMLETLLRRDGSASSPGRPLRHRRRCRWGRMRWTSFTGTRVIDCPQFHRNDRVTRYLARRHDGDREHPRVARRPQTIAVPHAATVILLSDQRHGRRFHLFGSAAASSPASSGSKR